MGMPTSDKTNEPSTAAQTAEGEQPVAGGAGTAVATREGPGQQDAPVLEPYVDPYKQVLNPFELPANTAAAESIVAGGKVEVSEEVPISEERVAQATEAIAAHQENVQAAVDAVGGDPRLGEAAPTATATRSDEPGVMPSLAGVSGEKTTGAAAQAQKARDEQTKARDKQAKEQAKAQDKAQKEQDKADDKQQPVEVEGSVSGTVEGTVRPKEDKK